jgi:hypothetical protein
MGPLIFLLSASAEDKPPHHRAEARRAKQRNSNRKMGDKPEAIEDAVFRSRFMGPPYWDLA